MASASSAAEAWAASGAMMLTGRPDGAALVPPDGVVARMRALGEPIGVDPLPLLGERAAASGLVRRGSVSCGGSARLLRAHDDWIVVNLAREDDRAAVPAWLETSADLPDPWAVIEPIVATRNASVLVERASLLGLPCARLGEVGDPERDTPAPRLPVRTTRFGDTVPRGAPTSVVDLSSLWAGPLCSRLLADAGARVTKVEATTRPDGARRGPATFFDRLNAGKRAVAVDLTTDEGVDHLRALIRHADVVLEASRPRALRQLGIVAEEVLTSAAGPSVWVSITGYGRRHERVAFGDDSSVAGGLVATDEHGSPCFVADAVADPLSGIAAASAVTACAAEGGRWLVDVAMASVAASVIGPDRGVVWRSPRLDPEPPHAPPARGSAPGLGQDTATVLAELRAASA